MAFDSALITSPVNMRYFSGFTGDSGCLLITKNARILYTDFRYTIQAKEQTEGKFIIRDFKKYNMPLWQIVSEELEKQGCRYCGYEDNTMTVAEFTDYSRIKCPLGSASALISSIRCIKSQDEIDKIIKAQSIAETAFNQVIEMMCPGMTEKEVAIELDYFMKKAGAEEPSFDTIIASGPNGALCHAIPSDRCLTKGDLVVMDFGARYMGYCSDMTRTVAIGEPSAELMKIYKIVREAQALTLHAVKPGITGAQLDAIARECITARGYGDCFGHSLGHGFGLEVHEAPSASKTSTTVLRPGMTVTVEPGIYVEGLGGVRIEDCVIVTEKGHFNPVTTTKDLIIIE
ncbi:MAG: aminopeptidase P family protein [Clostridia bacterium]|nr:aminopeptidase P family protein [Clostridia bacterium]